MEIVVVPSVSGIPLDLVDLKHKRRDSALAQLVAAAERQGFVRESDLLLATLARAEKLGATAHGRGFVLAHARSLAVLRPGMVLGRSERGVEWDSSPEEPVALVLLVLSPPSLPAAVHAARVSDVAHALRLQRTRQKLVEASIGDAAALIAGGGA
jgi:mannitol/fructose-specific phosphotransferase system IIA component (Ntr-type)